MKYKILKFFLKNTIFINQFSWQNWIRRYRTRGYLNDDEKYHQSFVKERFFVGVLVKRNVLFYEEVPMWVHIQWCTIGYSTWKSSFPTWCFKVKKCKNPRFFGGFNHAQRKSIVEGGEFETRPPERMTV